MKNLYFSFKLPKKSVKKNTSKYVILDKELFGVIGIRPDNSFFVIANDKEYTIDDSNFSCKKQKVVYYQVLDKHLQRTMVIRDRKDDELYRYNFLPFFVGSIIKGSLIQDNSTKRIYFKIKKVFHNISSDCTLLEKEIIISREILNEFRRNYKEYKHKRLELISKDLNE